MSTLVVAGARAGAQALTQGLGQALVSTASQTALSFANSAISHIFDTRVFEGPRLQSFQLMSSRDGTAMPRGYGRVRVAGQVIWASRLKEVVTQTRQGKGGPSVRDYSYTISFAIGLCEGEIQSVDRLWVNGQILQTAGLTLRVYTGSTTQRPDPIITAIDGDGPAYRGTAYVVFEDFPLDDYGARLPQINAEVTRVPPSTSNAPRLETLVTGVHLLPSSGEFSYATDIVEDLSNPGAARPVNMNNISGQSDILQALDQLETALPSCRNVSIVVSWFGNDLRAGECKLHPGVETQTRLLSDVNWKVSTITRESAYLVSTDAEGRPLYGGTPSDSSIMQAISALKQRGYKVMIYPFILMDITSGNGLPDPYGGAEQARFPWRGRITCYPAAGQPNTADKTAAAAAQIAAFFGSALPSEFGRDSHGDISYSGDDFGLRRFILHYAKLAQIAGGVDRFVISSEMVGLTTVRGSAGDYPAVSQLRSLLADVRSLLPNAKLSYAADWSEYFGHHPQDGSNDLNFHLDPLWADDNIDGVGIDAYFPLSDWRDGAHLDADSAANIYDLEYLKSNLRGGEGFDFHYASRADRDAQIRTTITDGTYEKPWVYRYKALFEWWSNPHINRQGGVETTPSPWVPKSKPFWLTEIGCPAVNHGANQPNVFYDPKSAESALPYYASAARDDLIQRRYIEAFISFYTDENNPESEIYDGRMVETDATFVWCWDARPYPDFPAREDVWSDGPNWQLGHWLTGRTGLVLVADVVNDLALNSGISYVDVSDISGVLEGYLIDRPMSARAALAPLSMIYGFDMVETAFGLSFKSQAGDADVSLMNDDIVLSAGNQPAITRLKDDPEGRLRDVRLHYVDGARDHQTASIFARDLRAETQRILDAQVPIVMDEGFARFSADRLLWRSSALDQSVEFSLSPMRLDLQVGDKITVPEQSGIWQISRMEKPGSTGGPARITARASQDAAQENPRVALSSPMAPQAIAWIPKPEIVMLDVPNLGEDSSRLGPLVGAAQLPFSRTDITSVNQTLTALRPVFSGALLAPLAPGPIGRFDRANAVEFEMLGAELASVDDAVLLSGANLFAVETDLGWEILQAGEIELIGVNRYRASRLLRGQFGSDADVSPVKSGARIIGLGQGLSPIAATVDIGDNISLSALAGGRESQLEDQPYWARHLRPLSPVHGRVNIQEAGRRLSWIRRTRFGGDSWTGLDVLLGEDMALFRVELFQNAELIDTLETDETELLVTQDSADMARISQGSTAYGFGPVLEVSLTL